ncbi:DUF5719 family protein [Streptomyces radicis]|uniref:Secreted protein n=1 Tax=Streptomyces radicis TaxID=1750517 RepID=A0A3A9W6C2_9ACTN|nr:DUF5719 family protein [Streptomyces radicis]RKN08751.1 hypothetical protein D7319_15325 [Streptomyces radicis]RKN21909.1 hypothetical protein D7318_16280 [Streptomyces radicis]
MNRASLSLIAVVTALAAVTGFASLGSGDDEIETLELGSPQPVQRTALTCPRPTAAEASSTWYTAFTPPTAGAGEGAGEGDEAGAAALLPAAEHAPGAQAPDEDEEDGENEAPEPVVTLEAPGTPVTTRVRDAGAPALTGTAEGALAPGWTVQQTTSVTSGVGSGLLGTSCQIPDTDFWFAGASTAESRSDYVHITNPDEAATVVDIDLYGPEGRIEAEAGQGITVPGGATVPIRLSTLHADEVEDLAVRVAARTGRVGAQIEALDSERGSDWLPPSTAPAGEAVLPGIPGDAESVRLVAFAPGDEDLTLDVSLAGPSGTITPAGNETVSVHAGTLTAVDLGPLTQGETGSLVLTPAEGSGGGPVVAALQVVRGEDDEREAAYITGTAPVEGRATISGSSADGTQLSLVAPGDAVEVDVTLSAGAEGGEPVTETYTVDGATTLTFAPEVPDGTEGLYALTIEPSGGPLYAARTLSMESEGRDTFTVQTVPDDRSTVAVPETAPDLSVLAD